MCVEDDVLCHLYRRRRRRQRGGPDCKTDTNIGQTRLTRGVGQRKQRIRFQKVGKKCALFVGGGPNNRFISETHSHIDNAAATEKHGAGPF